MLCIRITLMRIRIRLITLMRIRMRIQIQIFYLMRIRIRLFTLMRIRIEIIASKKAQILKKVLKKAFIPYIFQNIFFSGSFLSPLIRIRKAAFHEIVCFRAANAAAAAHTADPHWAGTDTRNCRTSGRHSAVVDIGPFHGNTYRHFG